MTWLVLLILAGLAGAALSRPQGFARLLAGGKKKPKLLPAPAPDLATYAEENGWRLQKGDDKIAAAEAWKLFALGGPPSLEVLYALKAMNPVQLAKEPEAYFREPWEPLVVITRDTADGPQTMVGARAAGGTAGVIACIGTRSTVNNFGLDIVGWDSKVYQSGEPPEGIKFDDILAGLSAPLRIRFAEGTLLLRVPGKLTPEMAATLLERLIMVRDALPRRPDLGPQR